LVFHPIHHLEPTSKILGWGDCTKGIHHKVLGAPISIPTHSHSQEERHQGHPRRWTGIRTSIPAEEGGEEAEHMEEDAPAPQQGGSADSVVISSIEYELLSGAHHRLEKLEERFTIIEAQSATHTTLLRAILDRLPPAAGASSSIPPGEQQ
jgi:hypothetical protein